MQVTHEIYTACMHRIKAVKQGDQLVSADILELVRRIQELVEIIQITRTLLLR